MKKLIIILILFCSFQGFGQIKGCWRFDSNSNDASGNGFNGTDTGITYSTGNGRINMGAGFDGTSSGIDVASNSALNLESINSTISVCVRINALPSGNAYIIQKGLWTTGESYWCLRITSAGKIQLVYSYNKDAAYDLYTSTFTITTGIFYHVVVARVFSTRTVTMYINSKVDGASTTHAGSTILTNNSRAMNFGYIYDWIAASRVQFLNCAMDELRIDNTVWSAAKVKNEYLRTKGFFQN